MTRIAASFLLAMIAVACRAATTPVVPPAPGIAADVAYLASPSLAGRETGTAGRDSAAAYIARQYERLGLAGIFPHTCQVGPICGPSYFQAFRVDHAIGQNIGVIVPGTDSSVRGQYVVIGAHYDHLGRSLQSATDRALGPVIRPGADDNASGTAAVLELARRLSARPLRRAVLLLHFDAEELGLVGSRVFVEHSPVPMQSVVLMVNLDMVGRLRNERLIVDASRSPAHLRSVVDSAAAHAGLRVNYLPRLSGRSDHASFDAVGVPVVHLFTGYHDDYHKATDVTRRLNLSGLSRVVDMAEAIVRDAEDRVGRQSGVR